jgi:putative transposase
MRRHGLSEIVRALKSFSARHINEQRNTPGTPVWQRNYYEHIVRSERALDAVRQYICDNPLRWELDRHYPSATGRDPEAADLWELLQKEAFGKFVRK